MKKFNATKMMALLMALCLITSTFVGSTLAKYTTSAEASDTARVAKFGVTVTAEVQEDGFKTAYDAKEEVKDASSAVIAQSVISSNEDAVVAPGTEGKLINTSIAGTPEVAVNVETVATLTLAGWTVDEGDYCPIEITVDGTTYKKDTMEELKAAVEGALNKNVNVAPNTNLAEEHEITWAWAFEGNDNVKDTALGDAAAAGNAATIKFDIKTTVTQID